MTKPKQLYGGLDPSYSCTACVLLDEDGALVMAKQVKAPKKDYSSVPARLTFIRDQVVAFFDTYGPELIAVEGYAHGAKFGREQAGELGGTLRVALWEAGFPYANIAVPTLKKFVTGQGNAKKDVMMREVFRKWAYEAVDDNDNDAYGLAQFAMRLHVREMQTKVFQTLAKKVEVVRDV